MVHPFPVPHLGLPVGGYDALIVEYTTLTSLHHSSNQKTSVIVLNA